jgi:hypothetical protein
MRHDSALGVGASKGDSQVHRKVQLDAEQTAPPKALLPRGYVVSRRHSERTRIWDLLHKYGHDCRVTFVGDATMSGRMYPTTLNGLEQAMKLLAKSGTSG